MLSKDSYLASFLLAWHTATDDNRALARFKKRTRRINNNAACLKKNEQLEKLKSVMQIYVTYSDTPREIVIFCIIIVEFGTQVLSSFTVMTATDNLLSLAVSSCISFDILI